MSAKSFNCSDGFCGADDCTNCHPELKLKPIGIATISDTEENGDVPFDYFPYEPRDKVEETREFSLLDNFEVFMYEPRDRN